MATLLDAPKPPGPAKIEEFVEKQLRAARRRLRVLDFFMAGLTLAVGSLLFLLAVLLIDRYVETPRGAGWAVLAGYVALAAGFIYLALFHPSRRQINPYFAARQVEQNVPNAKNSLVTWVDFEHDNQLPGSIRSAIGQKAARDLKQVDLNRAIENRKVLWLGIAAGVLAAANVVVAFLPPTRTELTIEEPKNGDITVFNNQDVAFRVHVAGRIPSVNDADAVRLRMWYNPDDPESYEERPMKQVEGERRKFALVVPAKQVRFGFRYKILAGNTQTPEYTVTCKIIPEFNSFEVNYEYPAYLKRAPETTNDPNLLAPYGSAATLVVSTNREVKHGHIEIEGQARTLDGQLIEGRPDAIQFTVPIEKEGFYRIWFTTPEGDKNQDPARLRLGVIDPKPIVRTFDLDYEYPAYLRFKPMSAKDVREPEIEAPRGSTVVMTAKTSRGVQDAKIELNGQTIPGEKVPDQPMWVRFKLPALDKDGTAKITFTPTTTEGPSAQRSIPVRALIDQAPEVRITKPVEDDKQLPANGTLELEGLATDDHGVDKLTLRMKVISAEDRDLKPKPYRGGMSFLRKEDNSWPTKVEYKDFVKLQDLRMEKNPNWRVAPGTKIEYWLEAVDNCAVPEPNRGVSKPKRIVVTAPAAKPDEQRKIEQQNKNDEVDQQRHEKKQDQQNANEKRDVQQQPPKGAEPDKTNPQEPKNGEPGRNDMNPPKGDMLPDTPPQGDPNHEQQTDQVKKAIEKAEQDRRPGDVKPDTRPPQDAKVDPGDSRPQPKAGPMDPPPAEDRRPKTDPNQPMMGEPGAGATKPGEIDKSKEDKGDSKPDGATKPDMSPEKGDTKQSFGGNSENASKDKPEPKDAPMPGMPPKEQVDKGTAHNKPKVDPKDPKSGDKAEPSATKPEKDVASSDTKKPSGEQGPMGDTPPQDAGTEKPRERPDTGGTKPEKKKDEVTDAGGSRPGPKDMDETAGTKPSKPMGPMDEQVRGDKKPGPREPGSEGNEQGDLDRELGELDREINSKNPKVDERKKRSVEDLMRDKEKREQVRKKLDELEKQADDDNDRLKKKKVEDMRAAAEKAAKDYDNEKPTQENVEKMANKLASNDPKERKEGEQRAKDWDKDPQTREEMKKQVDELKKKDRSAGEKAEDAMKKAEQARNQPGMGDQKIDEKQLKDIAKDLNGTDEKAKADAKEKLEKMMKDPKTAKEAKEKLEQMANNSTDPKQKEDLKNAAKEAGKMADDLAKKDPPMPKSGGDVDPKALEDAAKKLASGDPKEKKEAMDKLKEMAKDPKAAKEMQDKLKEMAQNAKTPEDKQALEDAAKAAQEIAKDMNKQDAPKLNPDDLKDIAKKLASDNPKAKEEAQKKMQEMIKDPKAREEARKMLEEMAKNMKNSPEEQKAIEEAMKEMARNPPPKMDPKDLADVAKEFDKMDQKTKDQLKKDFDEAMKDPKKREELKKMAEEMAKNSTPEQKKQFNDMLKQLGGPDYIDDGKPDPADPRNKLKTAELTLEKFKTQKIGEKLDWTDEQIAKWIKDQEAVIEALRKQVEKGDWAMDRNKRAPSGSGIVKPELGAKDGKDGTRVGGYAPPSGYVDPYKKLLGGGATEPKK